MCLDQFDLLPATHSRCVMSVVHLCVWHGITMVRGIHEQAAGLNFECDDRSRSELN